MPLHFSGGAGARREAPTAAAPAPGGLPEGLQTVMEAMSGFSLADVVVHRNSAEPSRLGAAAFTQGNQIHVGPGQERHLGHEAWHVVQQKQGRVKPTLQMKGAGINDDAALEREADLLGARALGMADATAPGHGPGRRMRAGANTVSAPVQLKALVAPGGVTVEPIVNRVYFNSGASNAATLWQVPRIVKTTRVQLFMAICAKAAELGAAADAQAGNNLWHHNPGASTQYFDPIRVRILGQYKEHLTDRQLDVDYHFGNRWSGYVIHVRDTGRGIDREMHDPDSVAAIGPTEFSNVHRINPHAAATIESANTADDVTKIAGEGARWKLIAANAGSIRDTSRIFTNQMADDSLTTDVRYIGFQTLFQSWASTFGKAYGIADEEVVTKLKGANVQTGTVPNVVNVAVSNDLQASDMVAGRDISADAPNLADQNRLAARSVAVIHYKKDDPSLVLTNNSFTQELNAAAAAVQTGAGPGAGVEGAYLGGDIFGFVCTWTGGGFPAAARYTREGGKGIRYSVPAYREAVAVERAKTHGDAPPSSKGSGRLATERRTKYDAQALILTNALAAHVLATPAVAGLNAASAVARTYPFDANEGVHADLLRVWSAQQIAALATAAKADRDTLRTARVNVLMQPHNRMKNLNAKKQKRKEISTAVALEIT